MSKTRYLALPVLLLASWWSEAAAASCVVPGGGPAQDYSLMRLNIPSGIPSAVRDGVLAGKNQWNYTGCNIGGDDFPLFATAGSGHPEVDINYNPGFSDVRTSEGNSVCGLRENGSITLFGTHRRSDGTTFNCPNTVGTISDLVAHELGHILGLGNVGEACENSIMAPQGVLFNNGNAFWFSNRQIQPMECGMADFVNAPPAEEQNECNELKVDPCPPGETTPIILDVDRNNFHLTGLDNSVQFDLDNDGVLDQAGWTSADQLDAFLCMDRSGNGIIDDGSELFGNVTRLMTGLRAGNGFIALAELDAGIVGGNENGLVDLDDPLFSKLMIWIDSNHNGFSEGDELSFLEEIGILAIELNYRDHRRVDQHGNRFEYVSTAWIVGPGPHPQRIAVSDVIFVEIE